MKGVIYTFIFITFVSFSCTPNVETNRVFDLSDLYFCGDTSNGYTSVPVYFNNQTITSLPASGTSSATDIKVIRSDIYVVGYEYENGNQYPVYWKNGFKTRLPSIEKYGRANSVFIYNGDTYIVGNEQDTVYNVYPILWKNGIRSLLTQQGGFANSVYVDQGNVYIVGMTSINNDLQPVIWKNGIVNQLSANTKGEANSVFISGTNIYIAGTEWTNFNWSPVYWKNGIKYNLPIGNSQPYAYGQDIYVEGNDVYVTGTEFNVQNSIQNAVVWKNGNRIELEKRYTWMAAANCIFVSDTNYFVGGFENFSPILWKNRINNSLIVHEGQIHSITYRQ